MPLFLRQRRRVDGPMSCGGGGVWRSVWRWWREKGVNCLVFLLSFLPHLTWLEKEGHVTSCTAIMHGLQVCKYYPEANNCGRWVESAKGLD